MKRGLKPRTRDISALRAGVRCLSQVPRGVLEAIVYIETDFQDEQPSDGYSLGSPAFALATEKRARKAQRCSRCATTTGRLNLPM